MGDVKLSTPRIRVLRDGVPELELQTTNQDMVAWDMTRSRQRPAWPQADQAPFLWLTFLSWHAAKRTGAIEPGSTTWEVWRDEVLEVIAIDDDAETAGGTPFPEAAEPD